MAKFTSEVHLSREMTLLDATMIGVGAMIGAGIFVLTGIAAGVAGPGLLVAFLLNAVVALLTAMSYAELGSCFHDAGGGYLWVKEGLPKWNGFLSGWMSWFAHAVACSLYALGFGAYFVHVLKEFGILIPPVWFFSPQKMLAVGISLIFAYVNFRGASETGKVGNFVTLTKLAILGVFVAFGIHIMLSRPAWQDAFTPFLPNGWSGVVQAMGLTFIAFQGFEVISQASEEIRNPRKNIPRAVFLSLLIVVPVYLLVGVASLGSVPMSEMRPWDYLAEQKETALVEVAKTFFVGGGVLLLVGGLISTMSALNATVYSSSRVAFAMGRDRAFPALFSRVHARNFTPSRAIAFSLIIIIGISLTLPIEDVASAADIMFLLLFLQVNVTLIRLRKKRPDLDRGFFVPWFPYLTILGIVLLLGLALYMLTYSPLGWGVTVAWIVVGLGIFRMYASTREFQHAKKVEALGRLERKDYSILVALSNPSSAPSLVSLAVALARKHDGEILLLHVVEVSEHQPLKAGLQDVETADDLLEAAQATVEKHGVPVRSVVRVSHRISEGIVQTASDEDCNFIILGRNKNPRLIDRWFSTIIDSVLQGAHAEVAVLHGTLPSSPVKQIVVPFARNIHTQLAMEIIPALTEHFRCQARIVAVAESGTPHSEREAQLREMESALGGSTHNGEVTVVDHGDVLSSIVEESKTADLMVMGGRSGDFLGLLLGQSLTQDITERAICPVLWLREFEERPGFWSTLFTPYAKEGQPT
jgi:amino acid transporter/nucleotide-binding universal stress UspA family protein